MTTDNGELSEKTRETLDSHNIKTLSEIEQEEYRKIAPLETGIWKWDDIQKAIDRIVDDNGPEASRHVFVPVNDSYDSALSRSLFVGIKRVSPGESRRAHRHGGNSLRFAVRGSLEMESYIGEEEFPMEENDLLTIPQWAWHGHENSSDTEVTWLTVHDTPLIMDALAIGTVFERCDTDEQPNDKPRGYHDSQFGEARTPDGNGEVPGPFDGIRTFTPPYRFRWANMTESLSKAEMANDSAHDPYDGITLAYTNPARGTGPLFPTYSVYAQRLTDGQATRTHRHNATEVYHVIDGSGQTVVGGEKLHWSERDIFVVPPNESHYHNPDGTATLINITDEALLESLNLYHEVDEE